MRSVRILLLSNREYAPQAEGPDSALWHGERADECGGHHASGPQRHYPGIVFEPITEGIPP